MFCSIKNQNFAVVRLYVEVSSREISTQTEFGVAYEKYKAMPILSQCCKPKIVRSQNEKLASFMDFSFLFNSMEKVETLPFVRLYVRVLSGTISAQAKFVVANKKQEAKPILSHCSKPKIVQSQNAKLVCFMYFCF